MVEVAAVSGKVVLLNLVEYPLLLVVSAAVLHHGEDGFGCGDGRVYDLVLNLPAEDVLPQL